MRSLRRTEGYPCYCPISHKIRICRSVIATARHRKSGAPKRYFVLLGKRNKPAKDRQLSLAMIGWSKVQFMTWHTSPPTATSRQRQHRCVSNIAPSLLQGVPSGRLPRRCKATSRNDIKCVARKTTRGSVRRVPIPNVEIIIVED